MPSEMDFGQNQTGNTSTTNSSLWDEYFLSEDGNNTSPFGGDVCEGNYFNPYVDFTQLSSVRHAYVAAYVVITLLSLLGNVLVIWTVWRNKNMRTVTNYYIVNLAVSDFLVALFVMPLKVLEYTAPCRWHVFNSDGLCSFLHYILPVFVFVSVLTLVAISIER